MNEKILVILSGTDEAIQYFNQGVLPSFDTFDKADYGSLHITEEDKDREMEDVMTKTKSAIDFINDDDSTRHINNIFLFIHSTELEYIKSISMEVRNHFGNTFDKIKFIYLTSNDSPMSQTKMNDLITFQKSMDFDYSLDDMMTKNTDMKEMGNVREKLYLLGDAIDISLMLDEVPNDVRSIILQKFKDILSKI